MGNNARIGVNCVVFQDAPESAMIVLGKPHVIEHDAPAEYYDDGACIWKIGTGLKMGLLFMLSLSLLRSFYAKAPKSFRVTVCVATLVAEAIPRFWSWAWALAFRRN